MAGSPLARAEENPSFPVRRHKREEILMLIICIANRLKSHNNRCDTVRFSGGSLLESVASTMQYPDWNLAGVSSGFKSTTTALRPPFNWIRFWRSSYLISRAQLINFTSKPLLLDSAGNKMFHFTARCKCWCWKNAEVQMRLPARRKKYSHSIRYNCARK